jgi:hypothetical protein
MRKLEELALFVSAPGTEAREERRPRATPKA